jgi:hypothetical protein
MAYVVARPRGRFEIRESVHTPQGSRARSLAGFAELSDEVLAKASKRASRPFDADAVRASAARAGAPTRRHRQAETRQAEIRQADMQKPEMRRFVESSRRMAAALETRPRDAGSSLSRDPGDALIDLLDLVSQVSAFGPARRPEPLRFPPLARLRAARLATAAP